MFNKKLVIIIVSAVLALAVIGAGIFAIVSSQSNKDDDKTTTSAPVDPDDTQNGQQSGTDNSAQGGNADSSQNGNADASQNGAQTELSQLILGSWKDSSGMSGYKFSPDGKAEMTYVDLVVPILNLPITGVAKGTYTLEGDKLTTTFSIYSASIVNKYTVSVENNTLKMFDIEELETKTYQRVSDTEADGGNSQSADGTDLGGSWINGDGSLGYRFNSDGTVTVTDRGNNYAGVYLTENDKLTVQYMYGDEKVTKVFTYKVSSNNLTLTDGNDLTILVRSGTSSDHSSSDDGIYGLWRDGNNLSGYEFKDGGVVDVTLVNFTVPVINMPINGTYTGSFTVDGDKLTVSYSVSGISNTDTFSYTLNSNTLVLTDEEGKTYTYIRQ